MKCNIIGSGNSLRNFDVNSLEGYNICLNHTYKHVDRVDMTVFFDNIEEFKSAPNPQYLKIFGGQWVNRDGRLNLKEGMVANLNATFLMALNIAIQKGFTEIHCYGMDNRLTGEHVHWYSDYKHSPEDRMKYAGHFNRINRFLGEWKDSLKNYKIYMYDSKIKHFINRNLNDGTTD